MRPLSDASAPGSDLRVTDLTTAYAASPLGFDSPRPRLGWIVRADRPGAGQTGYRIVVGTDPDALTDGSALWDTGPVISADTSAAYAGIPLVSRTRYAWAVQVTDEQGVTTDWSEPAWFETGLLDPADWQAEWIGRIPAQADSIRQAERTEPATLQPGHSLGQTFRAAFPVASVSLLPAVTPSPGLTAVATLRRGGPDGEQVAHRTADRLSDGLSWWLTPDETLPPGDYYLELADATGEIGWWSDAAATVPGGQAYADGKPVAGARTITVEAPAPPAPLLRKDFSLDGPIASARLYATGVGYHEIYLNGVRVSDTVLDPAFTAYDKRVLYNSQDVTDLLREGANAVGAALGRGLYSMRQANVWSWNTAPWNAEPALIAQLEVTLADGSVVVVSSGADWQSIEGPTRRDLLYGGDDYDARLASTGYAEPGYDATGWSPADVVPGPAGALHSQELPRIRTHGTIEPARVETLDDGARRYDFGGVTAGWARLTAAGDAGTRVTLHYGEKLRDNGHVDHDNWHVEGAMQTDYYTLDDAPEQSWRPAYSYKGFRYVEVSSSAPLHSEGLIAEPLHSDVGAAGSFTSSAELLNWIDEATGRTVLNNLHGIPTDTPFFEKNGWTADAHLIAESAIYQFDLHRFWRKWLADFRDAQQPDGGIPVIVPTGGWGTFTDPCWSSGYLFIAWNLFEFYGDADVLAEHYGPLRRYAECLRTTCADAGWLWPAFSHADWLAPGYELPPEGPKLAGTAFVHYSMQRMAQIAEVVGNRADAAYYTEIAAKVAAAFTAAFLDTGAGVYRTDIEAGYRQTSNLLPLALGLVPDDARQAVIDNLVADIEDTHTGHLNTGAVGTKYLLPVLARIGRPDLALTVALQTTHPSWGFWQATGANTLWEAWDANARSHDHYFLGTATQWLREGLVGLRPTGPGFRTFEVRPAIVDDPRLTHASTAYRSVLGDVAAGWRRTDDGVEVEVTVPVGATATVALPGDHRIDGAPSVALGAGVHRLLAG